MYAVLETGGKQYKVQEGDVIQVEKLLAEEGNAIKFDTILAISTEKGLEVGTPYLKEASVDAKVLKHDRDTKIIVFKYKAKKNYKKKQGHRQPFTRIKIEKINL